MRKKLACILGTLVLGCLGLPVSAQAIPQPEPIPQPVPLPQPAPQVQQPVVQPLPEPKQLDQPKETPPPAPLQGAEVSPSVVFPNMGCADPCGGPQGYWSVGGGMYFMQPYYSSNPAFFSSTTVGARTINTQRDVQHTLDGAPLAYAGYTFANGMGIRGRWFEFNGTGTAQGTGTINGITGTGVAGSNLHLNVVDLEVTYLFGTTDQWSVLVAGGARYATITQAYSLVVNNPGSGNANSFSANHSFSGFGPTIAFEGRYRLWDTCFALYGTARGSLLFGFGTQNGSTVAPDLGVNAGGSNNNTTVLPVGELEVGGEVFYNWGRFRVFAQAGVVGQAWWGAGNASQGLSLSNNPPTTGSQNNTLGFIGGVARLGVSY